MKSNVFVSLLLGSSLLSSPCVAGSMQDKLLGVYKSFGYKGNASGSSAFKDQKAGYYTGGGLYARKASMNTTLASLHLPSASMGCGGIDLYMGGMSFISKQEFVSLMRNIGASSTAYAFKLGIQTVSPQIGGVLESLQASIQDIVGMNINSCEAGATLVGSVWPRMDTNQQVLCKSMGTSFGAVSDYAAARQSCGGNKGNPDKFFTDKNKKEFEDVKPYDINVAWKAIHKNSIFLKDGQKDQLMKHIFMSISGTLVIKVDRKESKNPRLKVTYYPSKVKKRDFMTGLLKGDETFKVYACVKPEDCLDVVERDVRVTADQSLIAQVSKSLDSIRENILNNKALTPEQLTLIGSASIPVLKIMAIELAYRGKAQVINVRQYEDIIAYDIVTGFLNDIVTEIEAGLQSFDLDEKTKKQFKQDLVEVRRQIESDRLALFKRLAAALRATEHALLLEKKALSDFASQNRED